MSPTTPQPYTNFDASKVYLFYKENEETGQLELFITPNPATGQGTFLVHVMDPNPQRALVDGQKLATQHGCRVRVIEYAMAQTVGAFSAVPLAPPVALPPGKVAEDLKRFFNDDDY